MATTSSSCPEVDAPLHDVDVGIPNPSQLRCPSELSPGKPDTLSPSVQLETCYWLRSTPFLELEATCGDNKLAEEFLCQYRTFDDISAWKKRPVENRATFTISFASSDSPHKEIVGAACLFWEFIHDQAYVCLPYFGTMFGLRNKKLGMILVHFMIGRIRSDGYDHLYLPATSKAKTFWERMGGVEVKRPNDTHTKEVIEEMHCFSAASTTLMVIELQKDAPTKPNLPPYEDIEKASVSGIFFRTMRCGPYFQAAALIESVDRNHLIDMYIKGWSPLHETVQRQDAREALHLTQLLLKVHCNPDARDDEWEQTPLYFAATLDRVEIAKILVQYAANPDHRDVHHQPALFYAARHNAIDVVKYFVEDCGLEVNTKDKANRRAILYARQENANGSHANMIAYLEEEEAKRRKAAPKKRQKKENRVTRVTMTQKYSSRIKRKVKES